MYMYHYIPFVHKPKLLHFSLKLLGQNYHQLVNHQVVVLQTIGPQTVVATTKIGMGEDV